MDNQPQEKGDRIKCVRISNKLSQEEFGKRLLIKKASISRIESGINNPSDQTIALICSEFGINESWLRTGTGEMYKLIEDKLSSYVSEITDGNDDFIKDLIETYMELDESSKNALKVLAKGMAEKYIKREQSK